MSEPQSIACAGHRDEELAALEFGAFAARVVHLALDLRVDGPEAVRQEDARERKALARR